MSVPAGRAPRLGNCGAPPPAVHTPEGLGPRPPGTLDWLPPPPSPNARPAPRDYSRSGRSRHRTWVSSLGAGAEAGKALEGCPDVGALPGRGTCGFLNVGGSGWNWGLREVGRGKGLGDPRYYGRKAKRWA